MAGRLFRTHKAVDELPHIATARKVAAIVATLTADRITYSMPDDGSLPNGLPARLLGYFHGFSVAIWSSWAVTDARVAHAAARFVATSIFPQTGEDFVEPLTGRVPAAGAFISGHITGLADGERYVDSGCSGAALPGMLAGDKTII
ncbi:MAG TPA: hypothetical protein VGU69_05165 [Rhizomicrobium sp.]|nr:hypothetical protein [Rhizomicrobium sp.]